jgi:hypothetical protein
VTLKAPRPPRPPVLGEPVAVTVRATPERIDFYFPVEIHMDEPAPPVDLDAIAEHVFARLARRLS